MCYIHISFIFFPKKNTLLGIYCLLGEEKNFWLQNIDNK